MAVDVVVPEVGEVGMEVALVRWAKNPGEQVRAGDVLFEVDTGKAIVEVQAYSDGILVEHLVKDGDLVSPHQVVGRILAPGEGSARQPDPAPSPVPAAPPLNQEVAASPVDHDRDRAASDRPRLGASPRARRLAAEHGIDIETLVASSPDGVISARDVQAVIDARSEPPPSAPPRPEGRAERARRAVAEVTSASWRTIPHFYLNLDADVTQALTRARPTPLILVAMAQALARHPECNLAWEADSTVPRSTVDIGLLVDTPGGLLLPVIHAAAELGLADMDKAIAAAVARARSGVLDGGDVSPRSLTVSNLGMHAVDGFAAVITPPDPLMLAVGRLRVAPRWDGAGWASARILPLTLSVDHRAMGGAAAGRMLTTLEAILRESEGLLP